MGNFNGRKQYAIKQKYLNTIGKNIPTCSGIYLGTRQEDGKTFFYVGQSKNLQNRRFNYYSIECGLSYPTRHFEASLKKHKDYNFQVIETCDEDKLNEREKYGIDYYNRQPNYITRNDIIADNDIVKNNSKRINKVIDKYEDKLITLLKRLNISFAETNDEILISPKENKNGKSFNKISQEAYNEIVNGLKKLLDKQENDI